MYSPQLCHLPDPLQNKANLILAETDSKPLQCTVTLGLYGGFITSRALFGLWAIVDFVFETP